MKWRNKEVRVSFTWVWRKLTYIRSFLKDFSKFSPKVFLVEKKKNIFMCCDSLFRSIHLQIVLSSMFNHFKNPVGCWTRLLLIHSMKMVSKYFSWTFRGPVFKWWLFSRWVNKTRNLINFTSEPWREKRFPDQQK